MNNRTVFKHVYLCGPVSERPRQEAVLHFSAVQQTIRRSAQDGDVPICSSNPLLFCSPNFGWHRAMRECVGELARCGGVALLQGWQRSRGAALELKLADDLHIPVVHIEPPLGGTNLAEIFAAAPETLRYYDARLSQFRREGVEEPLAEERALAELANRYLDPHGFEYIDIGEEK